MVLGKLPVPGRPTIRITVGQGPTALAVGAGGGSLDIFTLIYPFFPLSPSLWETARYGLKYCLKGPLTPKTTNQPTNQEGLGQSSIGELHICTVKINIVYSYPVILLLTVPWRHFCFGSLVVLDVMYGYVLFSC